MRTITNKLKILLMCFSITLSFCSCGVAQTQKLDETKLLVNGAFYMESGNYIYFTKVGAVFRYHVKTGELSSACIDPVCRHDYRDNCPMWRILYMSFIHDNCLYYSRSDSSLEIYGTYESYDLLNGETKILKTYSTYEVSAPLMQTDGTYVYYFYHKLKPDGNPENADDYEFALVRQPLSGGNEETLLASDDYGLLFVTDDQLIFESSSNDIVVSDKNGEQMRVLFSKEDCVGVYSEQLLGDELYFLATDGTYELTSDGRKVYHESLYRLNVKTGESIRVLNDYVTTYSVDDDRIYYLPLEIKTLYEPTSGSHSAPLIYTADFTWYSCDLSGGDIQEHTTYENLIHSGKGRVIDGVLYDCASYYYPEIHNYSDTYFITIDMTTGFIKEIENITERLNNRE